MKQTIPESVAKKISQMANYEKLKNGLITLQPASKKFMGITIKHFFPGLTKIPRGLSFLMHRPLGWTLSYIGKWSGTISLFKVYGQWHLLRGDPTIAYIKLLWTKDDKIDFSNFQRINKEHPEDILTQKEFKLHQQYYSYDQDKEGGHFK